MALNPLTSLSNYIRSFGQAYVYTGNPFSTGGLTALGATEGEIQVEETFKYNDLTAPEWTGDTIHTRMLDGVNVKVTIPLIFGDPTVYTKISPDGSKSGGFASPQAVVTTSVVIMPFSDIPSTLSYNGSSWSPAAPVHAVWLWRAVPTPGRYSFKHADGGKVIREIVFDALFDDSRPSGHKVYSVGDPVAQGVTGLLI
jgi:hypothetical protein